MTQPRTMSTPAYVPVRRGRGPLLISGAVFSLGGGAILLVVIAAQLQASLVYGGVFAVVGIAQVGLAVGLLAAPARGRAVGAAAVSLAVIAVWVLARTVGLPGPGPWLPVDTAVGFTDYLCLALEALAALLLVVSAARWPRDPLVRGRVMVVLASVPPLLLAVILTGGGTAMASDGFTTFTRAGGPLPARPQAGTMTTLTYCTQHGAQLAMDVYQPPAGAARPAPVVLYVHGGGFTLGNRKLGGLGLANHAGALQPQLRVMLNQRGLVVASIDYRLAPLSPWPAPLQDAKCALRFLRAHAGQLGIGPDRIGVWGSSAGGTLAVLLGVVGPAAGFDQGQYADQSSAVQAVVDMFGAADLTDLGDSDGFTRTIARVALGGSATVRRSASPLSYLGPDALAGGAVGGTSYLILHGTDDHSVRPRHSRELARRLAAAGSPVELVLVQGAQHGLNDPSQRPTPAQLSERVASFLTRSLTSQ
jgi:acetyl esterase/lipase